MPAPRLIRPRRTEHRKVIRLGGAAGKHDLGRGGPNGRRQAGNQRSTPAAIAGRQRRDLAHSPKAQLHADLPERDSLADHKIADLLGPLDVLPGVEPAAGPSFADWIDEPVLLPFSQG